MEYGTDKMAAVRNQFTFEVWTYIVLFKYMSKWQPMVEILIILTVPAFSKPQLQKLTFKNLN